MGSSQNSGRYRVNPIEIAIFSVITVVFLNSIYNLLYNHNGFHPTTLVPITSNPISEGRKPASTTQSLQTLLTSCEGNRTEATQSNKVRLTGTLCGIESSGTFKSATVINQSNNYIATVFADPVGGKYSTDYIPLATGINEIRVEFSYSGRPSVTQVLMMNR